MKEIEIDEFISLMGIIEGVRLSQRLCDRRRWLLDGVGFSSSSYFEVLVYSRSDVSFKPHKIIWTAGFPSKIHIFT